MYHFVFVLELLISVSQFNLGSTEFSGEFLICFFGGHILLHQNVILSLELLELRLQLGHLLDLLAKIVYSLHTVFLDVGV